MLKSKLMKSLVVAGLICATSVPVFAAEQPEAPQPTHAKQHAWRGWK